MALNTIAMRSQYGVEDKQDHPTQAPIQCGDSAKGSFRCIGGDRVPGTQ